MNTDNWTAEHWKEAIRDDDSLSELKHLAGPSNDANEAARVRIERMDMIWLACKDKYGFNRRDWPDAHRENYERLQAEQDAFEADYC